MNELVKAQWVEALRSGKYVQGQDMLRNRNNRFCCLGVLCDLHRKEIGSRWARDRGFWRYHGAQAELPAEVQWWADLQQANPSTTVADPSQNGGLPLTLAQLNDRGKTFAEIAAIIERDL